MRSKHWALIAFLTYSKLFWICKNTGFIFTLYFMLADICFIGIDVLSTCVFLFFENDGLSYRLYYMTNSTYYVWSWWIIIFNLFDYIGMAYP